MNDILTVEQVAKMLQVSRAWVIAHSNGNRRPMIPNFKVGAKVRFRRSDVEAFIDRCSRNESAA